MATADDIKKQRKKLEQLADLREELAKINLSKQSAEADNLRKKINSVTEALVKMGLSVDRVEAFYEAFVRANAEIKDVSSSISANLLQNIDKLNNSVKEGADAFLTPIENLKVGAKNVIDVLQTTIKTSIDLEQVTQNARRENTRGFVEESIKLTQNLTDAYSDLIKNESNLGTAKFKNLNVEKDIADVLIYINELDQMKMQLAGGYYGKLREQATITLDMLGTINEIHETQRANNDLAIEAVARTAEINKEVEDYFNTQQKIAEAAMQVLDEFNQKQKSIDDQRDRNLQKRVLARADAISKEVEQYFDAENKKEEIGKAALDELNKKQNTIDEQRDRTLQKRVLQRADEINKEVEQYFDAENKKEEVSKATIAKIMAEQERADEKRQTQFKTRTYENMFDSIDAKRKEIEAREKADIELEKRTEQRRYKQMFDELEAERKKQEELQRIREREEKKFKRGFDSSIDKILGKLPGGTILQMLAKTGVVAQVLAVIVGTIAFLLLRWDNLVSKFTEKLSVSRAQAELTLKAAGGLANKLGMSSIFMAQVAEAIGKAQEGLGGMDISARFLAGNEFTERLVSAATVLSDTFGLTGQEIAGMTDASTAMGVSLSSNTIMVTAMSKGIMSANKLMQSLANLSPKILTGFKGSNAELISMVTKMKLLGVDANSLVSSNDKLLDIESSITNAFEAQVATGAQINIDRLMALQMNGKYSDLLDEQLKTLEQSDYLNRGPLAQELIAQGIGLDRETASQMLLRKTLADKVGLTDELIRKRQQEGKLVEDDIRRAEKQGKISKMEADRLREITAQYDSKTIQEKFIRALNDFADSLSSTLQPLIDVLRGLTTGLGGTIQSLSSVMYGLGSFGAGVISLLAGVGLITAVGYLGVRAVRTAKAMGSVLRAGATASATRSVATSPLLVDQYGKPIASGATAGSSAAGSTRGLLKNLKNMKGLTKTTGILSGIGAAADFGLNMSEGMSFGESAGRAGITGAFGLLGGMLGGMVPIPGLNVATAIGGSFLGTYIGDKIGDSLFGQRPSEMSSADAQFLQSQLGTASTTSQANYSAEAAQSQAMASEMISTMKAMSAKLDTANNVLSSINAKPSEVTVELDGEKVGKAVVNYTSATMDRNRVIGNQYGVGAREQTVYRSGK